MRRAVLTHSRQRCASGCLSHCYVSDPFRLCRRPLKALLFVQFRFVPCEFFYATRRGLPFAFLCPVACFAFDFLPGFRKAYGFSRPIVSAIPGYPGSLTRLHICFQHAYIPTLHNYCHYKSFAHENFLYMRVLHSLAFPSLYYCEHCIHHKYPNYVIVKIHVFTFLFNVHMYSSSTT